MFKTYANASAGVTAAAGPARSGGVRSPGGWHPTVISMLLLVIAEIVVAGFLSRHLLG